MRIRAGEMGATASHQLLSVVHDFDDELDEPELAPSPPPHSQHAWLAVMPVEDGKGSDVASLSLKAKQDECMWRLPPLPPKAYLPPVFEHRVAVLYLVGGCLPGME